MFMVSFGLWVCIGGGLSNVLINDLVVFFDGSYFVVVIYGCGMWWIS